MGSKAVIKYYRAALYINGEGYGEQIILALIVFNNTLKVYRIAVFIKCDFGVDLCNTVKLYADIKSLENIILLTCDLCFVFIGEKLVSRGVNFVLSFHSVVNFFKHIYCVCGVGIIFIYNFPFLFFIPQRHYTAASFGINAKLISVVFYCTVRSPRLYTYTFLFLDFINCIPERRYFPRNENTFICIVRFGYFFNGVFISLCVAKHDTVFGVIFFGDKKLTFFASVKQMGIENENIFVLACFNTRGDELSGSLYNTCRQSRTLAVFEH